MGANLGTTLTIDGTIDEFAGIFGITKVGLGKIIITGEEDNTYNGVTTVQAGVLNIQKDGALGGFLGVDSHTVVLSGAALELEDPTGAGIVFDAEPLTLNGPGLSTEGNLGALRNVNGNNEWTGDITLASSSRIGVDDGTQLTVTGNVGGGASAALTKVGTGALVFPSDNTYDGPTVVNQGVLNIRDPQALGNGTPDVNGTTVLDGATLQVQGGITVSNETLTLNGLGFFGQGALANAAGDNTWAGPIVLASDATLSSGSPSPAPSPTTRAPSASPRSAPARSNTPAATTASTPA
jgi:autotransporter-associated beta strand protein